MQGNGDFGPSIQFDTKGVDFGPWLRRFIAQIRRNWFVPYAAMSLRGHVVLALQGAPRRQHHRSAGHAAVGDRRVHQVGVQRDQADSNPTVPLPLEFPDENAPFIVTFYFNETPPGGGSQ